MATNVAAPHWPLAVYFALTVALAGAMVGISFVLGERHGGRATAEPYESGIAPTGSARARFSTRFYLIAMFFVIFDLETAFVFAWALVVREAGWVGYAEIVFFTGVLMATLVYLWRLGALDWWSGPGKKARGKGGRP